MALTDTIRQPVGPLPLWGWLVVGAGGFMVFKVVRGSSSSSGGSTSPVATASPITDTGVGGQTIQNTSVNPVSQSVLDKLVGYAKSIQHYTDAVSTLKAAIKKLQAIPANKRTQAQKNALAHDLVLLANNEAALKKYQDDLAAYEQGLITGSGGSSGQGAAISTQSTTSQLNAPNLSTDITTRFQPVMGIASTPPNITGLSSVGSAAPISSPPASAPIIPVHPVITPSVPTTVPKPVSSGGFAPRPATVR